jgi:WD40 repeat protein/serine/threonine protein kinase
MSADDALAEAVRAQATGRPRTDGPALNSLLQELRALHSPTPHRTVHYDTPSGGVVTLPGLELCDFLAPAQESGELGRLGPYRIRRVLGHGGMGVVFHAEDPQLERPVALKAILPVLAASDAARQRFLREGRAAASIVHDHVVSIYQVGEDRGVPFLAMQLLQGESLEDRLRRDKRLPAAEVLRIGREVALGLAAAHEHGLVHRDIKPANIWLEGERARVKILDFGLARASAESAQLTRVGAIVGTPAFMSPEQVNGQGVDERSDLFSLGCVLYLMATGCQPFHAPDVTSTLLAVARGQARPPDEVRPGLPRALSALILQLMAKDATDRPASATALVQTIAAIEADPSIRPRRLGLRSVPGPRRRIVLAVALVLILAALSLFARRQRPEEGELPLRTDDPDVEIVARPSGHIVRIRDERNQETAELAERSYQIGMADRPEGLRISLADEGVMLLHRQGGSLRVTRFVDQRSPVTAAAQDSAGGSSLLDTWKERNLLPGPLKDASRPGSPIEVAGLVGDPRFRVCWRTAFPAFSPDGQWIAVGSALDVLLFDRKSGSLRRTLKGHAAWCYRPVFAPDGKTLASLSEDATVRLWEVESGRPLLTFTGHRAHVRALSFSPDGAIAVSNDLSGRVLLWDVRTGKVLHELTGHSKIVYEVAFRPPTGDIIGTSSLDGRIRLYKAASGQLVDTFRFEPDPHSAELVFSPDGRLLLAGTDEQMKIWDISSRKIVYERASPAGWAAFTRDGRFLLTTVHYRPNLLIPPLLKRWNVAKWQEIGSFPLAGMGDWFCNALSSDGHTLATASLFADHVLHLYDVATGKQLAPVGGHESLIMTVAFSPNGMTLASAGREPVVRLWDLATGREAHTLAGHTEEVRSVAFSPNGELLASSSGDSTIRLWRIASGQALRTLSGHLGGAGEVAFSPDGNLLASAGFEDCTVRLWNLAGEQIRVLRGHTIRASGVAFSPDGRLLASGGYDAKVVLWDLAEGVQRRILRHSGSVNSVTFLADGRVLAVSGVDGKVSLWDVRTGARLRLYTEAKSPLHSLAARADGRRLAVGGQDGVLLLLDLDIFLSPNQVPRPLGRLALPLYPEGNWVSGVAFSPDGRHLAASTPEGIAVLRLPDELPAAPADGGATPQ